MEGEERNSYTVNVVAICIHWDFLFILAWFPDLKHFEYRLHPLAASPAGFRLHTCRNRRWLEWNHRSKNLGLRSMCDTCGIDIIAFYFDHPKYSPNLK